MNKLSLTLALALSAAGAMFAAQDASKLQITSGLAYGPNMWMTAPMRPITLLS